MKPRLRRLAWWSQFRFAQAWWPGRQLTRFHLQIVQQVGVKLLAVDRPTGPWLDDSEL